MRSFYKMLVVLCLLVTICCPAIAQAGLKGHWSPGLIGIRACTVPQHPGWAYKLLLHYQEGNSLREDSGKRALGKDHFKTQTLAASHRFLWTPDVEKIPFLGAQYNFQLIVPMISTELFPCRRDRRYLYQPSAAVVGRGQLAVDLECGADGSHGLLRQG